MKSKLKNYFLIITRYFALILAGSLLLLFLIRGYNTADDVTFNQGQVVLTVSQLMDDIFLSHLNLQELEDHKDYKYSVEFQNNLNDAIHRTNLLLNGEIIDGKNVKPLRNGKLRKNLKEIKSYLNDIKQLDEKIIDGNFEYLNKNNLLNFHNKFDIIVNKINKVKTSINNHFNLNRTNFHKYRTLSIIFTSILLLALAATLILSDKQKRKDIKLLNNANQALKEKVEQQLITRQKLQNEIQRNKLILDTTLNGFILADTTGNIVDVNPSYCEMIGYSKEELLKMNIKDLEAAIPKDHVNGKIKDLVSKTRDRFETKHRCKDGSIIDFDVSISIMNLDNQILIAAFLNDITQQKKIVRELNTQKQQYSIILNNIDEIVYQVNYKDNNLSSDEIVFVSPKTENIMGLKPEDFYNNPSVWFESIHPDDVEIVKESTSRILNSGKSGLRDYRVKNKTSGEYRWIEDRITPLFNNGKLTGIVGVARDVTEWVNAKSELEEKELRYRTLFNLAPNGIMLEDRKGNIIDANPALYSNFGYEEGELIGKNVSIFTHPENKEKLNSNIDKILKGETLRHTLKSIKKDGSEIYIRLSETKIQLPNLEEGLLCVSEDITDNIRMQEALKKSEEKYKKLIEISPVGITIIQDDKIVFANTALSSTLGFSGSDELIGKSILDFVHPDYVKFTKERLLNILQKKQNRVNLAEEKFIKKNGKIIDVLVVGQKLEFENGIAVQGYIYDISEQKMLTVALRKSQERLQEAQKIAHLGNWDWNIETNELFWSDEVFNIFGLLPQEFTVTYDAFINMVHPEDREHMLDAVNKAINENKPYNSVHRIQLKNKQIKFVQEIGKIYFDSNNKPIRMVGTVQDITELKKTEMALIESERRISGIMKAAPVGIGVVNNRVIEYINDFLCNLLGYSKDEMEGKPSKLFYQSEEEYERIGELYEKALKEGVASGETKIKHKSGIILDAIISLCPLDKSDLSKGSIFSVLDITKRKKLENHLKIEEARYRGLFEYAPISIWEEDFSEGKIFIEQLKKEGVTDFHRYFTNNPDKLIKMIELIKVLDVNTETVKFLKAKNKQQVFKGLKNIFIPESLEAFKNEISSLAEGKTKFSYESKQRNFKNEFQDIYLTLTIAPGFEDTWKKVFVTVNDITEQKKSEEAIKTSEANLRSLIEGRHEAIWSIDTNYNLLIMNDFFTRTYQKVYGIEPKKGMNALEMLDEKLKKIWKPKYDKALAGERINFQFKEYINNNTHYFDIYLNPIYRDNKVSGISIISIDTTDKVEAEEQVRYQAKLLDSAQDAIIASKDLVIENNLNNAITYWNKGAEKLYGWKSEEVLGKEIREVIQMEPVNTTMEKMQEDIQQNGEWTGETIQYDKFGNKLTILMSVSVVYENGKIIGSFGVNHNITELKEAYNKLEESQIQLRALAEYLEKVREEERTYIAREIHDDLGQALTALKIDLSWLNKNYDPAKNSSKTKIDNMIKLVNSTIETVQKISSQLRPGLLDDLGIVAAIEWATNEFQRRTGINCNLEIKPSNFETNENISVALFRIFQEILTNITRHANAKDVNINIYYSNKEIVLDVRDNGIGIDEAKIDDPKSLGLLGIKERTRTLGGSMEIKGMPGEGTRIKVILPING